VYLGVAASNRLITIFSHVAPLVPCEHTSSILDRFFSGRCSHSPCSLSSVHLLSWRSLCSPVFFAAHLTSLCLGHVELTKPSFVQKRGKSHYSSVFQCFFTELSKENIVTGKFMLDILDISKVNDSPNIFLILFLCN
jgi:hypothetical protein